MIIKEKKIVFCHIDKTAGSSIKKCINPSINCHSDTEPIIHNTKHMTMKQLLQLIDGDPSDYFKFAFVRNPYDRALSKYFQHKRVEGGNMTEKLAKNMTFPQWVKAGGLKAFRPQYLYCYDESMNFLCDFIGRFENLNIDYDIIRNKLDLCELVHLNKNNKKELVKNYLEYYDEETIQYVTHKYRKDFELFGYSIIESNLFDIVIPVGPNDTDIILKQINYTRKNIMGYSKIFIVTPNQELKIDGCETVSEDIFPFSISEIADKFKTRDRSGWYLQQLIKLYSGITIPSILSNYLVIDADTFFIKPTNFFDDNKALYNFGREHHKPYFEHIDRLNIDVKRELNISGICHHMMFQRKYVEEIINKVEETNNDTFINIFLKSIPEKHREGSGASEYELYFNYMLKYHDDKIKLRFLPWTNTNRIEIINLESKFVYVSYHWYLR